MSGKWNGTYHVAPGMKSTVGKCTATTLSGCPYNEVAGHHKDHATQVAAAERINEAQSRLIETHKANGSQKSVPEVRTLREAKFILASKPVAQKVNRAVTAKKGASKKVSNRLARKSSDFLEDKFRQQSKSAGGNNQKTVDDMKRLFAVKYWMPDVHAKS